ncbi:MAG: hypothetical protein QOH61_372 [Chloroflexota bacterium]|jgi:hypothetical protein|nr:hypothetical protein [Chloroflexota bacterium]
MSDLIVLDDAIAYRAPSVVALPDDAPSVRELFDFMAEAELRVQSLRMRIRDTAITSRGEETEWLDVAVRHPGHARVLRRRSENPLDRDYDVWITDGVYVRTYEAVASRASVRPLRWGVVGADRPDLPPFSRLSKPLTQLPAESIAETFVHPYGYARNVLSSGRASLVASATIAGHEAFVVRSDHPRSTQVLNDRPDHWIEVGIDRATGFLLLLVEHIGEAVSRHAEVTQLELDPPIPDDLFELHLSSDVRMLY